ncbi:MAG: hypothetical protein KIS78_27350 [Labilithrix sp.]|nr:hypothetical protein [Labilithrix sp.]
MNRSAARLRPEPAALPSRLRPAPAALSPHRRPDPDRRPEPAPHTSRRPPDPAPSTASARLRRAAPIVAAAVASLAAACGGAEQAARSPAHESSAAPDEREVPEPRTVEEALDQIARAEESLHAAKKSEASAEPSAVDRAPPRAGIGPRSDDTCGSPCRALASMKRAVDALCRMTGDTDNRCVDARRTLEDNTTRVASCKCEGL